MKKLSLLIISTILMTVSCQVMIEELDGIRSDAPVFIAETEHFCKETKTSLTAENSIIWSKDDRISIFCGSTIGDKYRLTDASAGSANGAFELIIERGNSFVAGNELPVNIALYPYSSDAVASALDTAFRISNVILPATQSYTEGSFDNGSFAMVAVTRSVSDHTLKFRNVLGAMKLGLLGECQVKSIKVEGRNSEKLSGKSEIIAGADINEPTVRMDSEANTYVTLNCGGVQLDPVNATEFIIALPPVEFTNGFKVTVRDTENKVYTLETETTNTVHRSHILRMPAVTIENGVLPEDISNEPIVFADPYVKERCVTLYDTDGDNELSYREAAAVRSLNGLFCSYETRKRMQYNSTTGTIYESDYAYLLDIADDVWQMTSFDELEHFTGLTEIDPFAFYNCDYLESVKLPENIQKVGTDAFVRCFKLKNIKFPDGIKEIYSVPWYISNLIIPEGVTTLSGYCYIYSKEYMATYPDDQYCTDGYLISLPKSLTSFQLHILTHSISNNDTYSLTLSGSALAADGDSFVNEDGTLFFYCGQKKQAMEIPEGVKNLNFRSLFPLNDITSITLPSTLEEPSYNPFTGFNSLTELKGKFASSDGKTLRCGDRLICVVKSAAEDYAIPSDITVIGEAAFYSTGVKTADLSHVAKVERMAFSYCENLTDVTLPSHMRTIPYGCFHGCMTLRNINLDQITTLGDYALGNCKELLKRFKVPGSVREIGYRALASDDTSIIEFESLTPPVLNTIWTTNEDGSLSKSTDTFTSKQTLFVPDASYARYSSGAYSEIWPKLELNLLSELYDDPEIGLEKHHEMIVIHSKYGEYPLIRVESGSFTRVSPADRTSTYEVNITKDFYIGLFELPQWLWKAVLHTNPSPFKDPIWPVYMLSGKECLNFISELNKVTEGFTFRLPTEAEWEYAAHGGRYSQGWKYSGGDDPDYVYARGYNGGPTHIENGPENELRLRNMNGNVWEYCSDYYYDWRINNYTVPHGDDPYVSYSEAREIMGYPDSYECMVLRGGDINCLWDQDGFIGTDNNRIAEYRLSSNHCYGFRLAIDATIE